MRDLASKTIDRHEPILPDYIQGELSASQEKLMTRIKNEFIYRCCSVGQIKRYAKNQPKQIDTTHIKIITRELLDKASECLKNSTLSDRHRTYVYNRGLDDTDIKRFNIVSTQSLVSGLSIEDITNLSLKISDKFSVPDKVIDGVSIPYFFKGELFGFCTRILNNDSIKYSITIPQRFCFGIDSTIHDTVVIVEGVFDAIPLLRRDINCMALGDSQPNYWKMLQASRYDQIYLVFDNDYSGKLGAAKCHVILEEMLGVDPARINIISLECEEPPLEVAKIGIKDSLHSKISLKQLAAELTKLGENNEISENTI